MDSMVALFTRHEYAALPEGYPAQLIDGFLVKDAAPTLGHQICQLDIVEALRGFVPRGQLILAPTDVLVDEFNVFQPDIVVLAQPPRDLTSHYVDTPLVVFEILSSSTARRDRGWKARRLLGIGVKEVWLVDPRARTIERLDVDDARNVRGAEQLASQAIGGFSLVPDVLFRPL